MKKALVIGMILVMGCFNENEAQQPAFSAYSMLAQSSYEQWTGDNGLVSNNITSAIRDRKGFVWITSYNGIMRFDGVQVHVYDETKIPFLTTGAFYAVYEDKAGVLWFSSQSSGVIRYREGEFERLDPQGKILPSSIRSLKIAEDGTVWVGSNNSGLYKIKGEKIERINCPDLNETSILEMTIDSKNNLWLATDGKGLYKYDGRAFENIKGVSSEIVNSVFATGDNTILIGTPLGLDILKENKLHHHASLRDIQVNKVICDQHKRVWVGLELGLGRFDLNDESAYSYINEKNGYPMSRVNFLYLDDEQSLWVSTGRDGLVQLRESNIVNITSQQGLTINKINMVYESPDKSFYIGSDGGTVDVYKHGLITPLKIKSPIHESGIRDIYVEDNTVWIASYRGVLRKTKNGETLYDAKDGLTAIDVRRILSSGNALWFATRSGGVMKFKDGKVVESYTKGHGLESNYALALEKDRHGNIYVGTHSGGMSIIHPDGKTETFHTIEGDEGILIFNIHVDNEGKVWTVGNSGLLHFDGKKFQKIKLSNTLKGEIFFDWVEDNLGNVWVTGNLGVLKILKEDILKFLKGETEEVKFKLFDNRDGMKSKECTSATRSLLSSSGRIWVPTVKGISVFYPEKTIENKVPPPVYITSFMADDEELEEKKGQLIIEPGKLRYAFLFTAPSFISPRKIQFKYRLESVDEHWINAGTSRQAEYTNLAPGNYTFTVLACNNDGVWNEKGASLSFTVKPFFYQTAYFYAILGALLLLTFYAIYKWRINAVEKRNQELRKLNDELDRFVYSASHDLRAPLASVLGLVNIARMEKGRDFDGYLDKIESSVQKLDGFIRDIIDFSRNARLDVESDAIDFKVLITEIFDNLKYLDEKDVIKRIVKVEGDGVFYSDKKRLTVVLNNLIANSIKYSNTKIENPFIEVYVKQNSRQVLLQVNDNGIGIGREHISNIFKMFYRADSKSKGSGIGLYIVKETLEKIQGTISVQSEYGKGSTFTILLKALKPSADKTERVDSRIESEDLSLVSPREPGKG